MRTVSLDHDLNHWTLAESCPLTLANLLSHDSFPQSVSCKSWAPLWGLGDLSPASDDLIFQSQWSSEDQRCRILVFLSRRLEVGGAALVAFSVSGAPVGPIKQRMNPSQRWSQTFSLLTSFPPLSLSPLLLMSTWVYLSADWLGWSRALWHRVSLGKLDPVRSENIGSGLVPSRIFPFQGFKALVCLFWFMFEHSVTSPPPPQSKCIM